MTLIGYTTKCEDAGDHVIALRSLLTKLVRVKNEVKGYNTKCEDAGHHVIALKSLLTQLMRVKNEVKGCGFINISSRSRTEKTSSYFCVPYSNPSS